MSATKMPETLLKKLEIAQRICDPMNDKKFQFKQQEDGTWKLSGLDDHDVVVTYRDTNSEDGKLKKGFRVTNGTGKKVLQDTTLDVGIMLKPFRKIMEGILNPAPAEATEKPAESKKAAAKKSEAKAHA